MPRVARLVVPGCPHHVTQRGNRRQRTFFRDEDYEFYLSILTHWTSVFGVDIWSYCLMPNHVHLVAVPTQEDSLRQAMGRTHQQYTEAINAREKWTGCLWQGRFASFPMDEGYLYSAVRYVELNPVRAGLAADPFEYPWSSAAAHLRGRDDRLVSVKPMLERAPDWRAYLAQGSPDLDRSIRKHASSGLPAGDDKFISEMEKKFGMSLRPLKTGPKGPRSQMASNTRFPA